MELNYVAATRCIRSLVTVLFRLDLTDFQTSLTARIRSNLQYTQGEMTSQNLWLRYDRHFVGITWHCVELRDEDLSCYLNSIRSVSR